MIMFIFLVVALAIGLYFYTQKKNTKPRKVSNNILKPFISSQSFIGEKKGYVFKNDVDGIGYYLDKH